MGQHFDTTASSVVTAAQGAESGATKAALEVLRSRYWPPLYTYARMKGSARKDAEDPTQEFFARETPPCGKNLEAEKHIYHTDI